MLRFCTEKEVYPMPKWLIPDNVVTPQQAAEAVGYSQQYVCRLASQGRIAGRKVGSLWLIDLDSLRAHKAQADADGTAKFGRRYDDATD